MMNTVGYLGTHTARTLKRSGITYPSLRVVQSGSALYTWNADDLLESRVVDDVHCLSMSFDPEWPEYTTGGFVFNTQTALYMPVEDPRRLVAMSSYMLSLLENTTLVL